MASTDLVAIFTQNQNQFRVRRDGTGYPWTPGPATEHLESSLKMAPPNGGVDLRPYDGFTFKSGGTDYLVMVGQYEIQCWEFSTFSSPTRVWNWEYSAEISGIGSIGTYPRIVVTDSEMIVMCTQWSSDIVYMARATWAKETAPATKPVTQTSASYSDMRSWNSYMTFSADGSNVYVTAPDPTDSNQMYLNTFAVGTLTRSSHAALGTWVQAASTHFVQSRVVADGLLCCCDRGTVRFFDVTNPASPSLLSDWDSGDDAKLLFPMSAAPVKGTSYVHVGLAVTSGENLCIFDVSVPASISIDSFVTLSQSHGAGTNTYERLVDTTQDGAFMGLIPKDTLTAYMYSLSNPLAPGEIFSTSFTGSGDQSAWGFSGNALEPFEFTNGANPTLATRPAFTRGVINPTMVQSTPSTLVSRGARAIYNPLLIIRTPSVYPALIIPVSQTVGQWGTRQRLTVKLSTVSSEPIRIDGADGVTVSFTDRTGAAVGVPEAASVVDGVNGLISFSVPENLGSPAAQAVSDRDGDDSGIAWPITRTSTPLYFYVDISWPDGAGLRVPSFEAPALIWVTAQPNA